MQQTIAVSMHTHMEASTRVFEENRTSLSERHASLKKLPLGLVPKVTR